MFKIKLKQQQIQKKIQHIRQNKDNVNVHFKNVAPN